MSRNTIDDGRAGRAATNVLAARGGSFPLIALLQLATFSAALVACVDSQELTSQIQRSKEYVPAAIAIAMFVSASIGFIGMILGSGQFRFRRSALVGGAIAAVHGLAIVAAFVAPAPLERSAAAVGMLLVTTVAFRIRSD